MMDLSASAIRQSVQNSQAASALQVVSKAAENEQEANEVEELYERSVKQVRSATEPGVGRNVDILA